VVLAAVAGFAIYLRLARTRMVNSDGASQALQAWDILHGNILLHGWQVMDVSFFTTEIPEYMAVEVVHGIGPDVIPVSAAITYTLVVLLAAALAKGTATGREAVIRMLAAAGIMLAPQIGSGTDILLSSPAHLGSSAPILAAWLILERARPRWWVPVATTVLLGWSAIADEVVLLAGIVPLVALCALRLRRRDRSWRDAALAGGGVVAAAVGLAAPRVIRSVGGFAQLPVDSTMSPAATIVHHNLRLVIDGLLVLFGAYFRGLPAGAQAWFAMLHVVGVALVGCGIVVTAWRFFRGEDLVPRLLLTGIVIDVAAYLLGSHAQILDNAREMAPVVPFAAVLAARQLPRLLAAVPGPVRPAALPALGVVLAGYGAGLGVELTATPESPPLSAPVSRWLTKHPLPGTGLSGYWESNVVTLTTAGKAKIRSVAVRSGEVVPHSDNTRAAWFDPARSDADYVVLGPDQPDYKGVPYPGFSDKAAVVAQFGRPARVYHAGAYTILQWHKNLLNDLP
jgi:hypothetical protein